MRRLRPSLVIVIGALGVCAASPLVADPSPCPRRPPRAGAACASPRQRCGYGRCESGGHYGTYAVCEPRTRRWRRERGPTCNPPTPVPDDPTGMRGAY